MGVAMGFTATRDLLPGDEDRIKQHLNTIDPYDQGDGWTFVTGGCREGDKVIGTYLYQTYRLAEHVVIVPANRSQVDDWWSALPPGSVTVVEMPEGTTYKDRNQEIVNRSYVVWPFASWPEDDGRSRRSGTWQTKRLAEKAGVTVRTPVILRSEAA